MPDEYISREAAISAVMEEHPDAHYPEWYASILAKPPAADVAPVEHARWLEGKWPNWPHRGCSRCRIFIPVTAEVPGQYWQYCPNCGARMDGGTE